MAEVQMKKMITFKQTEKELYDFLLTKRSISVYVKDLIEADMKGLPSSNNITKNIQEVKEESNLPYDDF